MSHLFVDSEGIECVYGMAWHGSYRTFTLHKAASGRSFGTVVLTEPEGSSPAG